MALSANKIKMVKQSVFIPHSNFSIAGDFVSLDTGGASVAEIGTSGIAGVLLDADGEMISGLVQIPTHCDRENDIGFKVVWSSTSTTAADKANWKLLYKEYIPETTVVAVAATALDTVIPTDTVGDTTASVLRLSPEGILKGGTLGNTSRFLGLQVEMDDLDTSISFYGVLMEFTPKFYKGRIVEAPAWQNIDA